MTALHPGAAGVCMRRLGLAWRARFGAPRFILALSAHTLARELTFLGATRHEALYDFGGFDPALRTLRYEVAGAPEGAAQAQALLAAAGLPSAIAAQGGLDHGLWTPLRFMFPQADIPVLPLAWNPRSSPQTLWAIGQALSPLLDEDVMIIGSGSITHNLGLYMQLGDPMDAPERPPSAAFREWFAQRGAQADWPALLDYRRQAPHAVQMHPTDEHLLPWFAAAGAASGAASGATAQAPALRLHSGAQHGVIGMDLVAFGPSAPELKAALEAVAPTDVKPRPAEEG